MKRNEITTEKWRTHSLSSMTTMITKNAKADGLSGNKRSWMHLSRAKQQMNILIRQCDTNITHYFLELLPQEMLSMSSSSIWTSETKRFACSIGCCCVFFIVCCAQAPSTNRTTCIVSAVIECALWLRQSISDADWAGISSDLNPKKTVTIPPSLTYSLKRFIKRFLSHHFVDLDSIFLSMQHGIERLFASRLDGNEIMCSVRAKG